jgi:hypothetical protein
MHNYFEGAKTKSAQLQDTVLDFEKDKIDKLRLTYHQTLKDQLIEDHAEGDRNLITDSANYFHDKDGVLTSPFLKELSDIKKSELEVWEKN